MRPFTRISFLLVFALATASALAAGKGGLGTISKEAPIDIQADSFSAEVGGWVVAEGNVLIRQGDSQVTADRIRTNKTTGEIIAEGNVVLIREGQGATRSERLAYNYKTGEGITPGLNVQSGVMRVISKESRRLPDGSYDLNDIKVTTCTNDESHLHYFVKGHQALFWPEQYVMLRGATLNFCNAPLFYWPSARKSLVDHFGWRFEPGYESDWGGYLLTTYKRQLADLGGEFHDSLDSYTHIDYRTARGLALGEDVAWHFGDAKNGQGHYGLIGFYGIFDDDPMNTDLDREAYRDIPEDFRYRVTFSQDSSFSESDTLAIRASYLADSYLLEDFYEDEYKQLVQPDNYAAYTHTGTGWSAGLGVYHRLNAFYDSINRMPDAWIDVMNTQIGDTPFYYESQTAGGVLQREYADYDIPSNTVADAYECLRIDTRQAIYLPGKYLGFLSVVPRAVYRGTYYGKTLEERESEAFDGTNVVRSSFMSEEGGKLRNIFELGAEASFKAYGLYEDDSGRYRHVVEPYLNYTFIPEPNVRSYELYQFDSVDKLDKSNSIKLGFRQQLQRKIDDKTVNLIDADLYAIYDLENSEDESELREIGLNSEFRPTSTIRIDLDGVYDAPASEIDNIDLWMTLWQGDRWEAAGEFYYRPDICAQYAGALAFNINEYWGMKIYARYDSELARLEEINGYIQYNLDCISFRLRGGYEPAFTRDDGTERDAKIKVSFYAWLRAFPQKRYERKLRDGYLE